MTTKTTRIPTLEEYVAMTINPYDIVDNSHPIRPRARKNPNGEWTFVGIKWVVRDKSYLVSITRADIRTNVWRVRVWMREDPLRLIMDESGYHTVRGAEWAAYDAISEWVGIDSFNPGKNYRRHRTNRAQRRTGR